MPRPDEVRRGERYVEIAAIIVVNIQCVPGTGRAAGSVDP